MNTVETPYRCARAMIVERLPWAVEPSSQIHIPRPCSGLALRRPAPARRRWDRA